MRTGTVAVEGFRVGWRARILRPSRIVLALIFVFTAWSVSGRVDAEVPGFVACEQAPSAGTSQYLTGEACPPARFAETMGYEPILVATVSGWRYTKPAWAGGYCSAPMTDRGPFWDFEDACQAHDYGYDLVRFGIGDRSAADDLLYRDMLESCGRRDAATATACRALARWAHTVLTVGDATGFDPKPIDPGTGA